MNSDAFKLRAFLKGEFFKLTSIKSIITDRFYSIRKNKLTL